MREILFRAKTEPCCKDVITGEILEKPKWIYGYIDLGYMRDGQGAIISDNKGNKAYRCQYSTIGQYTGRTDKNGKRVFEGDIIRLYTGVVGVVLWHDNDQAYLIFQNPVKRVIYDDFGNYGRPEYYEVIGNIHDNPELLEGGADHA